MVPVLICFAISAGIEILVFQSVFTVLGFQTVAVFLALSLELFKLIVPVMLVHNGEQAQGIYPFIVISLRLVLFIISFCCTFVAIANNLVDTNIEKVEAQNETAIQQAADEFNIDYQKKMDNINAIADKKIVEKSQSYDLEHQKEQLRQLNETYSRQQDWATYSLILELNQSVIDTQEALNADLNAIEQDRSRQLAELETAYSPQKLEERKALAIEQKNARKYDITQNTNITKVIYLVKSTLGVEVSYEWVIVFMALLICFASECIIWTGSVYLVRKIERYRPMPQEDPFELELKKRLYGEAVGDPQPGSPSSFAMVAQDRRLMKRLSSIERRNLSYQLLLMQQEKKNEYLKNRKELALQRKKRG